MTRHYQFTAKNNAAITLDELTDLVAEAHASGVDGSTPVRVDTSLKGALSLRQPGVHIRRVYLAQKEN